MFAIFAIIIAIIIFILRGFSGASISPDVASPPYEEVAVIPRVLDVQQTAPAVSVVPQSTISIPAQEHAPERAHTKRARRNVSFSPRTEIREFNVNGGEIIGQYSKAIGS